MRCAAGGATTTCSPTCSAPGCSSNGPPERVASCTATRPPGTSEHGLADDAVRHALAAGDAVWAARLIERHFDALSPGRRGSNDAAVARRAARRPGARPAAAAAGPGADGAGRRPRGGGRAWRWTPPSGACAQAAEEPFEPSVGRAASLLANVPRERSPPLDGWLAWLRGDAEGTTTLARHRRWPSSTRASGCWTRAPGRAGPGRLAARSARRGRARPRAASIAGWRAAGERGSGRIGLLLPWPGPASPRAAWTRRSAPTGRRWRSPTEPGRPALTAVPASPTWAWPRWPTSGTSWTPPCATSPRASRVCRQLSYTAPLATGLATLAGSGRPAVMRPARWRRWARPSGSRPARRD